jgi:hypothetical protein
MLQHYVIIGTHCTMFVLGFQRSSATVDSIGGNADFSQQIESLTCYATVELSKVASSKDLDWRMPSLTSKTVVHVHSHREFCRLPVDITFQNWIKEELSIPNFLECIDKWD